MSIFQHVKTKQCLTMGDAGHSYNTNNRTGLTSIRFQDCNHIMGYTDLVDDKKYYLKNEDGTSCIVPDKTSLEPTSLQSAYEMMVDADTESIDMARFGNKVRDLATTEYGLNNNTRNSNAIWKAANDLGNKASVEYHFNSNRMTWEQHEAEAINWGGHLASIENEQEFNMVVNMFKASSSNCYLGGKRTGNGGNGKGSQHWMWTDGTPWSFTKWHPNEPNNAGGRESYLITSRGHWNDIYNEYKSVGVYKRRSVFATSQDWNALKQAFVTLDFAAVDGVRSYNIDAVMGECDEDGLFQVYKQQEAPDTPIEEIDVLFMFSDNHSALIDGTKNLWSYAMEYPGGHIRENIVGELGYAPYVIQSQTYLQKETIGGINWCIKRCPAYIMSGEYFIGRMDRELDCGRSEETRYPDTFKIIVENREDNNNTKKMRIMRTDSWNNGWGMRIIVNFPIDLSIYRTMFESSPEPNEKYSFLKGGPCHYDYNVAMNSAMATSGCVAIGQQSNGCWHLLKKDVNGKTMAEHTCGSYVKGWEMVPKTAYNQSTKYAYLGCYHDRPTRALNAYHGRHGVKHQNERAINWCANKAKLHGDKYYGDNYFGLQNAYASKGPQCFSGHSLHRATKYGKKDCEANGSGGWANAIYALFPSSDQKLETKGYYTLYDMEETISEKQLIMEHDITITCKIKYTVEAINKDNVIVGKSIYYLIHHDDGKVNKLFFSPMEPDSKKDEKLIVNITPGYTQTYDDEQGREDQHTKNFSVTTISTNDGYKALVNTDIVPDGMALSKTAHTRLRTIPRNDSIFPFLFLYHYPKDPDKTLINLSSFLNPFKKIRQLGSGGLISRNENDDSEKDSYIFKLASQEGFTERFTLDQGETGPVYSMGKVGDWPWGACPGFKDQNAEWIWHTAGLYAKNGSSGLLIYEYDNITGSPIEGRINIIVDNFAKVYVNGDNVGEGRGGWRGPGRTSQPFTLNTGKNMIMVDAMNGGGPAGLLMTCYNASTDIKLFSTNMNGGWKSISVEG